MFSELNWQERKYRITHQPHEVENWTAAGWLIVGVVTMQRIESFYGGPGTIPVVVETPYFVLAEGPNVSAIQSAQAQAVKAKEQVKNLEATLKNTQDALTSCNINFEQAIRAREQLADRIAPLEQSLRKMEAELGAVRKHFGNKAVEEAIAATTPTKA